MRATRFAVLLLPIVMAQPLAAGASDSDKIRAQWRAEALRDVESDDAAKQIAGAKYLDVEAADRTAPLLAKHLSHEDVEIRRSAASLLWTLAGKKAAAFEPARAA